MCIIAETCTTVRFLRNALYLNRLVPCRIFHSALSYPSPPPPPENKYLHHPLNTYVLINGFLRCWDKMKAKVSTSCWCDFGFHCLCKEFVLLQKIENTLMLQFQLQAHTWVETGGVSCRRRLRGAQRAPHARGGGGPGACPKCHFRPFKKKNSKFFVIIWLIFFLQDFLQKTCLCAREWWRMAASADEMRVRKQNGKFECWFLTNSRGSWSEKFPVLSSYCDPSTAERAAPGERVLVIHCRLAEPEKSDSSVCWPASRAFRFLFIVNTEQNTEDETLEQNSQIWKLKDCKRAFASDAILVVRVSWFGWLTCTAYCLFFFLFDFLWSFLVSLWFSSKQAGGWRETQQLKKKEVCAQGFPGNLETCTVTRLNYPGWFWILPASCCTKIHLFTGRAVKRERRKGSSLRQQPAYGAAVNEVARELLCSARSPKRENGGRRYIKHDGMIASPVGSCLCCWQLPLSPPVPPLYCSAPHCPSLSPTRFDAFKDVIVSIVHNMLPILSEQPRHLGYRPVYVGFPYDL